MAETITIAGKKLPKTAVYVAGAGMVGFVGYAWFTKGTSGGEEPVMEEIPEPVEEPTDEPGFTATSGSQPPTSNSDWSELAVLRLMNIGHDGQAVSSAIGKFLARKPLNKVEVGLVQEAIRAAGPPPQNGPWVVIEEPLPGPVTAQPAPGAVRNLRASTSRTQMAAAWNPPADTTVSVVRYHVEFFGGSPGGGTFVTSSSDVSEPYARSKANLKPNHQYGVRVRAIGANGKTGPYAISPTVRTDA